MQLLPDIPTLLTIAGLDPSGAAGLLADIKAFEMLGVYGMAVCTANTVQNVSSFGKTGWTDPQLLFEQLEMLQKEVHFEWVKIGLIENLEVLSGVVRRLKAHHPPVKIIWDPVCRASAGFVFHENMQQHLLEEICHSLYLITPNLDEIAVLCPGQQAEEAGRHLSGFCNVLLKGGHSSGAACNDMLFTKAGTMEFDAARLQGFEKRGTGCVLSAAILASLAKGESLPLACGLGKTYVRNFMISNHSLTGTHHYVH